MLVLLDDAALVRRLPRRDALLFAARRLGAELRGRARGPHGGGQLRGAFDRHPGEGALAHGPRPQTGTAAGPAGRRSRAGGLAGRRRGRLREASDGNPLALAELALLPVGQLRGVPSRSPIPCPWERPAERLYSGPGRDASPKDARRALLVAALSSSPAPEPVVEALRLLGVNERSLEPARGRGTAGRARGGSDRLPPPHWSARRSSTAAPPSERRRAHRALADALAGRRPEERAWHLAAAAALGPDEDAAAALAEAGRRARARSGWGSATLALERSARPDPRSPRPARGVGCEGGRVGAGRRADRAEPRADRGAAGRGGARGRGAGRGGAAAQPHRAALRGMSGPGARGPAWRAADRLGSEDPAEGAMRLLADAVEGAESRGEPRRALDAAARAAAIAPPDGPARFATKVALGQAHRLAGPSAGGAGAPRGGARPAGRQRRAPSGSPGTWSAARVPRAGSGASPRARSSRTAASSSLAPRVRSVRSRTRWRRRPGSPTAPAAGPRPTHGVRGARARAREPLRLGVRPGASSSSPGSTRSREARSAAAARRRGAGGRGARRDRQRARTARPAACSRWGAGRRRRRADLPDALDWATLSQADGDGLADPVEAWVRGGRLDRGAGCVRAVPRAGDRRHAPCGAAGCWRATTTSRRRSAPRWNSTPWTRSVFARRAPARRAPPAGRPQDRRPRAAAGRPPGVRAPRRAAVGRAGGRRAARQRRAARPPRGARGRGADPPGAAGGPPRGRGRADEEVGAALFLSPKTVTSTCAGSSASSAYAVAAGADEAPRRGAGLGAAPGTRPKRRSAPARQPRRPCAHPLDSSQGPQTAFFDRRRVAAALEQDAVLGQNLAP